MTFLEKIRQTFTGLIVNPDSQNPGWYHAQPQPQHSPVEQGVFTDHDGIVMFRSMCPALRDEFLDYGGDRHDQVGDAYPFRWTIETEKFMEL